jgi:hypothetical protein
MGVVIYTAKGLVGMKTYHIYGHFNPVCVTEKAYQFAVCNGNFMNGHDYFWVPKSACIVGEPNEVGNQRILIPDWIFRSNRIDPYRVEMTYWGTEKK